MLCSVQCAHSLSHSVVGGRVVLLEAGLCEGQVLVAHGASQAAVRVKGCVKVCGVAGGEGADAIVTKRDVAARGLERFLQA